MENVLIMKDYYTILEVNRNASIDEIKKQYKILARKYHPDKGGDENKFKEISEAFQILSDPQKKSEYDNPFKNRIVSPVHDLFSQAFMSQMFQTQSHSQSFSINDLFGNMNINSNNSFPNFKQTIISNNIKKEITKENINGKIRTTIKETNLSTGQRKKTIIEQ